MLTTTTPFTLTAEQRKLFDKYLLSRRSATAIGGISYITESALLRSWFASHTDLITLFGPTLRREITISGEEVEKYRHCITVGDSASAPLTQAFAYLFNSYGSLMQSAQSYLYGNSLSAKDGMIFPAIQNSTHTSALVFNDWAMQHMIPLFPESIRPLINARSLYTFLATAPTKLTGMVNDKGRLGKVSVSSWINTFITKLTKSTENYTPSESLINLLAYGTILSVTCPASLTIDDPELRKAVEKYCKGVIADGGIAQVFETNSKNVNPIINRFMESLKPSTAQYRIVFTCEPHQFLRLGTRKVDENSCFRPQGENRRCALDLATTRNSCVVLIKRIVPGKDPAVDEDTEPVLARGIACFNFLEPIFPDTARPKCNAYLSNWYALDDTDKRISRLVARLAMQSAFNPGPCVVGRCPNPSKPTSSLTPEMFADKTLLPTVPGFLNLKGLMGKFYHNDDPLFFMYPTRDLPSPDFIPTATPHLYCDDFIFHQPYPIASYSRETGEQRATKLGSMKFDEGEVFLPFPDDFPESIP